MDSLATVAIVPRERFSFSERSLESVLQHTPNATPIVYIDGNSPTHVQQYLENRCADRHIGLVREDNFLSPNVARNKAAALARTKYLAFIDNDVLVTPDWLEKLVHCAESTGAWAVGPLYCQGEPAGAQIHMAGGKAHFYQHEGRRYFRESHTLCGKSTVDVLPSLQQSQVELLEFHTMLVRTDIFERFGKLDEEFLSVHEHVDLCLSLRTAGLGVYMEPASVVTYVGPQPLEEDDMSYFKLRWCDAWNRLSMNRFREKWGVCPTDPGIEHVLTWATNHRCKVQTTWHSLLRPLGRARARRVVAACEVFQSRRQFALAECLPGKPFSGQVQPQHSKLRAA